MPQLSKVLKVVCWAGDSYPPVVGPVSPRDKVMACIYIRHNVLFSNEPIITVLATGIPAE